jgi:MoxR-like ATPase
LPASPASATSPTGASATAVFLALTLRRPLFLEGEPGVGKTELAKALAGVLAARLLRVQCYEGLDIAQTAYEWNVAGR